jgi:LCP family protein required for cell wall assembly
MTGPIDGPPAEGAQPEDGQPDGQPSDAQPEAPSTRRLPPELDPRGRRAGGGGTGEGGKPGSAAAGTRPPKKRLSRRRRILTWTAGSLAVIIVIGSATGWVFVSHFLDSLKHINPFCSNCSRPSGGVKGDLNILLVGSDSRSGLTNAQEKQLHVGHAAGQRSDTMILLHIPRGGGKAILVSLPRDSYVTIPRHKDASGHIIPASMNKLNAAYSFGGAALTVRTIEYNTHVRIDHYVEVNFQGFVNIVNHLGGVSVCTPTPISDPVHRLPTGGYGGSGLELPAGRSTLNGVRALEYVRAREFDPSADLGRIQRQQKFMAAMVQKAESAGILLDLPRLYGLLGAVGHSLVVDKNFGLAQIKRLAAALHSLSPSNIELLTVPLKPGSFNTAVGNVVEWDPVKSRRLFHDLTDDLPLTKPARNGLPRVTIPPSSIHLDVLNSTSTKGLAATAAAALARMGFGITRTANSPAGSDPAHTVVRYGPGRADSARTLAASVPGATLKLDPSFGNGLQLLVGSNYSGVRKVRVVAGGQTGSLNAPRTAAQDICS